MDQELLSPMMHVVEGYVLCDSSLKSLGVLVIARMLLDDFMLAFQAPAVRQESSALCIPQKASELVRQIQRLMELENPMIMTMSSNMGLGELDRGLL